jgi:glycosyltransferase involved in cell wall biosynthesis
VAATKISGVIITYNEERRLRAAIESIAFCDEVLVVDSGSADRTREIAEDAGARVIVHTPWPGFSVQRNFAIDQAQHDWVLALDADERVSPGLRQQIEDERERGFRHPAYRMPRVSFYLGRWIRRTDWYPDWQTRLFDRRRARWHGVIHESVKVEGTIGHLRAELEHHPYEDIADHLRRIDRYTTLWAQEAHAAGRRAGLVRIVLHPVWAFFRNYILRGGVWLGTAGVVISTLNSFYVYAKHAKLGQLGRQAR